MTAPALTVRSLCKNYGGIAVTRHVDLELPRGARHALIGPNGAGKTTLVGLMSGAISADSGTIELFGRDITTISAAQRVKLGLVRTFQVNSLFPHLSVFQNVFLACSEADGVSRRMLRRTSGQKQVIEQVNGILDRLGLLPDAGRPVATIAYGRQRLVELGIALALEPSVLLLDEPAAGVPSVEVPLLINAIDQLGDDITILLIEHDMQIVQRFARTMTVLAEGEVIASGSPDTVMASEKVRSVYLGKSGQQRFESGKTDA
ncbi:MULTISPECIES: ABC transporter ATP-binding protein [unclassified Beijerinckia]|uniref:ABC transporter ATP-binding protein n=1 Tax=unclassified Beijerinckia TaxID=2638183 RepID=UPI000897DC7E|nr:MULTISPECIES: ABC transporter ATP-binding protein [unclassified Beijerinckia]MDH7799725.1 branched-chain amino acid transport system ATP-binding protein [Beijerinckia sp. GAS462]SED34994.1 branched-chain amino acid transport system ATP-binding protein [Beijerinckia sp. 28-YEA-48]